MACMNDNLLVKELKYEKIIYTKLLTGFLKELDKALAQQDRFIADKILQAMKKKGKPLEEVLRLINL